MSLDLCSYIGSTICMKLFGLTSMDLKLVSVLKFGEISTGSFLVVVGLTLRDFKEFLRVSEPFC